jgi:hypothetical protein
MLTYTLPPGLAEVPFKDGGHWFTHNGKYIRSVSKILNEIYPMPPDLDPFYLERGKLVHHATTMIDKGTIDWATVDERIKPFCTAYLDFITLARPVVEASELIVVHPSYRFGARLDRVMRLHGQDRLIVVDIKTGMGKEPRYWLQVAACAMALDEAHVGDYDLAFLNLDKQGKPHFTVENDAATWINKWREVLEADK